MSTLGDYVIDKVDFFLQWNACMPLPLSFGNCLSINTHAFQASEIIIWNGAEFQSVGIDPIPSEHTDGAISLVTEDEKCRVLVEG